LLAVFTLAAQEAPIQRQGADWVRAINGIVGVGPQSRLEVRTRGSIVLRGVAGKQVTYRVVQRVRAETISEARSLLGEVATATQRLGDLVRLTVAPECSPLVRTELEISAPSQLPAVILETGAGGVEAYDFNGSVQAITAGCLIHGDRIGGAFLGRTGGGEIRLGKIGGPVQCISGAGSIFVESAGGETTCHTAGGDVGVGEASGPVRLSTEGGNIRVGKAASTVEAHSAEGVIDIGQAGGTVIADTRGGSIQVGSARGVRCESAAGAVRVKTSSAPLRISTAVGSILAELLAGTHLEDSSLVAEGGDITVLIPSNLAVSVMARSDSGGDPRIVSDFSEIHVRRMGFVKPPIEAQGAINGGGPVLHLNTAGGTIYLRRLK